MAGIRGAQYLQISPLLPQGVQVRGMSSQPLAQGPEGRCPPRVEVPSTPDFGSPVSEGRSEMRAWTACLSMDRPIDRWAVQSAAVGQRPVCDAPRFKEMNPGQRANLADMA